MKENRFVDVYKEGNGFGISKHILVDRETGVYYLFVQSGYGAAITPLLNANGEPTIHKLYEEK